MRGVKTSPLDLPPPPPPSVLSFSAEAANTDPDAPPAFQTGLPSAAIASSATGEEESDWDVEDWDKELGATPALLKLVRLRCHLPSQERVLLSLLRLLLCFLLICSQNADGEADSARVDPLFKYKLLGADMEIVRYPNPTSFHSLAPAEGFRQMHEEQLEVRRPRSLLLTSRPSPSDRSR
jgi:hypothetical protein